MKIRRLRFAGPIVVVKVSGAAAAIRAAMLARRRVHPLPVELRPDRHDDVHALAARRLDEGAEPQRLELVAHVHRRLDHLAPGDALAGVEVEDHAVGPLERLHAAPPGMELDDSELRQRQIALGVADA